MNTKLNDPIMMTACLERLIRITHLDMCGVVSAYFLLNSFLEIVVVEDAVLPPVPPSASLRLVHALCNTHFIFLHSDAVNVLVFKSHVNAVFCLPPMFSARYWLSQKRKRSTPAQWR